MNMSRNMKVLFGAFALTVAAASARAEVVTEDLVNPNDPTDVWGKKITGLGDNGDETALVFTKTGETLNWTLEKGVNSIWYLVAGGGGSGGASAALIKYRKEGESKDTTNKYFTSGGGGGGGMLEETEYYIDSPFMEVVVGAGGEAVSATVEQATNHSANGKDGGNSSLVVGTKDPIVAHGGGGGGGVGAGRSGGSGGGAGNQYTSNLAGGSGIEGEGHDGGNVTKREIGAAGGGGAGGAAPNKTTGSGGGKGGAGLQSDITGVSSWYCAGGGGGGYGSSGAAGAGGEDGGGAGSKYGAEKDTVAGSGTTYGCGGGGTCGYTDSNKSYFTTRTSGAGYQGVVIVRYKVLAADVVEVPTIEGVDYNGMLQKAVVPASDGYTVTKNDGGVDAGDYDVVLTLVEGYKWYDGSTEPKTLVFTISKIANSWTAEPSLSMTTWEFDEDPATVNAGAALSETAVVVTYGEGVTEMPLTVGDHTAVFMVEESQNYLGLSKTINYTIGRNTNIWTAEPSLTKTTWAFDEEPGEIVAGGSKYGELVITYDGNPEIPTIPTAMGSHTVKFTVAETDTYTGLEKVVDYTVTKKQHKWTVEPNVPATVNIEDGVSFPMPVAEPGVEVKAYFDGDPEKTELTEIAVGESHTVTYAIAGDDDWDEVKQTFTFKGVYKAIVDPVDPSKVYGYRIPKLGANQDEVALVFTNTGYTADSPMSYRLPQAVSTIDYLVIGGGGGGGGWTGSYAAGGGGAGGVVSNNNVAMSGALSIVVGKGGAGCSSSTKPYNNKSGGSSSLVIGDAQPVTAYGGGKGGCAAAGTGGEGFGAGGGGGSTASGGKYVGFAGGAAGQGFAGGTGGNTTYRGGGGGGAGEPGQTPTSTDSGKGGDGIVSDITGKDVWYAGGGGGGSQSNNGGIESPGGKGGGGKGGFCSSTQQMAGHDATYFGGGGGSAKGNASGGSGYQGVVIVRYVEPAGVAMVPTILPKTYTGETLVADVPANVGYTVTENEGGTDVGDYDVVLTLNVGYHWDGGSTEPTNLTFAITQAQNEWTVDPSIMPATWLTTDDPGVLTAGETKFGTSTATIVKDGGDAESFDGTLPTAAGQYVITYKVETSDNWIDPEVTEKSVSFEIVSGDVVPPFTVTKGEMTTVVGEGQVDLSVGYAVHCAVESDKKVDIYAYIAEDGSETTNEVKIAEGATLDAMGVGTISDLEPGVTYWVALGGRGGETVAPPTEFTAVTVPGSAMGLAASATFTNDPKEFVITGSVTPGLGTTTVYVRWSLNSDALDQSAAFPFQYGDAGAFTQKVAYAALADKLTWDVAVSNNFTSTTYGEQKWDAVLPASTKTRTDMSEVTYTWTGNGGDGLWTNVANWSANRADNFGYPNAKKYATAKFTKAAEVDLDGGTFGLVAEGLKVNANIGDVTLCNGEIDVGFADFGYGASGTTVIFDNVTISGQKGLKFVAGSTVVFRGTTSQDWIYEPWNPGGKTELRFEDGLISSGFFQNYLKDTDDHRVYIDNAVWTLNNANKATGQLATKYYLIDGVDRQAQLVNENTSFSLNGTWYIPIPATGHAKASIVGTTAADAGGTFQLELKNWKRGKRVPLVTYTGAKQTTTIQGLLDENRLKLSLLVDGKAEDASHAERRNGHLEWDAATNTLYYKQNALGGFALIVK